MDILVKSLDEDQVQLASNLSENLLVLAGPGSGKTRVITHRVAYLFRAGVVQPPRMVLGITFTNKAAAEMRGRIRQISSVASAFSHIMTFHKFGENFLRHYGYLKNIKRNFVIYDEKLQAIALKAAAKEIGFRNLNARDTVSAIEKLKSSKGFTGAAVHSLRESGRDRLADLLEAYSAILTEKNAVDFSDLLCLPLEIVSQYSKLSRILQDIYSHVLIDECQDTNHVQLKLVQKIFEDSETVVFGVADEDQSIYMWRGARIQNLRDFLNVFDAEAKNLRRNYRCHPSILRVADSLILNSEGRLKQEEFVACRPDDGECRAYRVDVPDLASEGLFVADMITELKDNGLISDWKDVTVLGRNWGHLQSTAEALREAGIPNIILNEADIPDTDEVNVLLSAIRSCASPEDDLARDLVIDYLGEAGHGNPNIFNPDDLIDHSLTPVGLIKKIRKFLGLDGLLDTLGSDEMEQRVQAMDAFQAYCTKVARLAPELSTFSRVLTLEGHSDQGKEEEAEDAVNLMSIHTSKGTERKTIFILALDAEIFPRFDIDPGTEHWEEERRLLYVSITRAEDYLYLVHCENRPTWSGNPRRRDPSPLLLEIDQNLLNCMTYP